MKKSREKDADSFSCLPDEIILQILYKLIDLKTLCCCYLASKRFSSIVSQIDAISFTTPPPPINAVGDVAPSTQPLPKISFFRSVIRFMSKFSGLKTLCIQLTSSSHDIDRAIDIDNRFLFKWKVSFCSKVKSFIFLSPNSICGKDGIYLNGNGNEDEVADGLYKQKVHISLQCLKEAIFWHMVLLDCLYGLPKLQEVSIVASERRGRLSLSGKKLCELKEWVHSTSHTEFYGLQITDIFSYCYIPVLKLPVAGCVMKGLFCVLIEMKDLQGGNDGLLNSDDVFQDKEGAAYTEAVKEILEKHKAMMHVFQGSFL